MDFKVEVMVLCVIKEKTEIICRYGFCFQLGAAFKEFPSQHPKTLQGDFIWEPKDNIQAKKSTFDSTLEWKLILNLNYNNYGAILAALLNLHKTKKLNFVEADFMLKL